MERRGLGPDDLLPRNPGLVYTRLTGWGQTGPYAHRAGHDINYLAISGALGATGVDTPVAPPALLGDLATGSFLAALGTVLALFERQTTGAGQVVDAAIVDGAAALMAPMYGLMEQGGWVDQRESNMLDGGQPWYRVYRTSDDKWLAVGAIEPQFWSELLVKLEIPEAETSRRDPATWSALAERIAAVIGSRTRDEWEKIFAGSDACAAPVRSMTEAPYDPHLSARETFVEVGGHLQPAPAPRFSRTPSPVPQPATASGSDTADVLRDWGVSDPG
jgi:alpha-methylacyl-CoA racemase